MYLTKKAAEDVARQLEADASRDEEREGETDCDSYAESLHRRAAHRRRLADEARLIAEGWDG